MGLGLQGAFGLDALDQLVAQRKAEQLALEDRTRKIQQQQFENQLKLRGANLADQQAGALEDQRHALAAERQQATAGHIAGFLQRGNPVSPETETVLRAGGLGDLVQPGEGPNAGLPSTRLSGFSSLPGAPQAGGMIKTVSSGPGATFQGLPTKPATPYTLKRDEVRYDENNQPIAWGADSPAKTGSGAPLAKVVGGTVQQYDPVSGKWFKAAEGNAPRNPNDTLHMLKGTDAEGNATTLAMSANDVKAQGGVAAPRSAVTQNRVDSARALMKSGDRMTQQLSDPTFAEQLGPALGRYNNLRDFIGNPPPEFSKLAGEIESFALANMGVHGMRSAQGAEQIKKFLDAHHTPESLAAGIDGLLGFSRDLVSTTTPGSNRPQEGPLPGQRGTPKPNVAGGPAGKSRFTIVPEPE